MDYKDFIKKFYDPTCSKANGKKFQQLTEQERMVLAIGDSIIIIDKNRYAAFESLMKELQELECKAYEPISKKEYIKRIATTWNVDVQKLVLNINKIFA